MSEPADQRAVSDAAQAPAPQGVGASVRRNEDRRLLDGGGAYLADLQVPGLAEIAFLRSPVAHGRIRAVEVPPRHRGSVFFAADVAFAKPIVAVGASAGFKYSEYPALASNKVRFVGDLIGICVAPTRAEAEDIAQSCSIDFEELPPIWDIDVALAAGATPIHDDWTDNIFAQTMIETGDLEAVRASAPMTVHKRLRMERHAGVSLECRGVLAHHERRLDELIVYSSTQFPHVIRTMLAQAVGLSETHLRVIAPDVGGGFGIKNNFNPEEIAVTALALKLGKPLRWIEDRREHLIASPHAREHRYELTAHADERGRILKVAIETPSSIRYGALLPHVAFEERRVPDASNGLMPLVAAHIAYRAVRTRGTIGGAIALADPAADWLTAMLALEAQIALVGPNGRRTVPIADFVTGPYSTALGPAELIEAVEVPRRAATERWGRCKVVRKTGEYAESMAIAVIDRARRTARVVVGALDGAPLLLPGAALAALADRSADVQEIVRSELAASAFTAAQLELHSNVALRAIKHACE